MRLKRVEVQPYHPELALSCLISERVEVCTIHGAFTLGCYPKNFFKNHLFKVFTATL